MHLFHSLSIFALGCLAGCALHADTPHDLPRDMPPTMLLGDFVDDYGIGHRITDDEWLQRPDARYRVVAWHAGAEYLIARNDAGKWTRIDWVTLPGMPSYAWAFCLSAWDAATQAEAERADIARRDTPKTGCNGYPFSRMRRVVREKGSE